MKDAHGSTLDTYSEQLEIHSRKIKQLEDDERKLTTQIDELVNREQLSKEQKNQKESLHKKVKNTEQLHERLVQLQQHDNSATEEEKREGKA